MMKAITSLSRCPLQMPLCLNIPVTSVYRQILSMSPSLLKKSVKIINFMINNIHMYDVNQLKIEFVRSQDIQYQNYQTNKSYDFEPIYIDKCKQYAGTNVPCGDYLQTEFHRGDPMTYIKLKNKNIWMTTTGYTLNKYDASPFFIQYVDVNRFVIFINKQFGDAISHYLQYNDSNTNISWTLTLNKATVFAHPNIRWVDWSWFKL